MEVTLSQMLDAREQRSLRQQLLLKQYHRPLVCFTMNIAGPVKDSPLIRRGFRWGMEQLEALLDRSGLSISGEEVSVLQEVTGCEAIYPVACDPLTLKALTVQIEDATPLGRLFDMDVLAPDGRKLDRDEVAGGPRNCIVCGKPGRECASRRLHTVEELQTATRAILTAHFASLDREALAGTADSALRQEVDTTPKPGLVDRANNGSHTDMDPALFYASADALLPYWRQCVQIGQETAPQPPEETFALLRAAGLEAEKAMLTATHGVNTHKGAIFLLGTLCGAAGRLWSPEAPFPAPQAVADECAALTRRAMEQDLAGIAARGLNGALSWGERLYLTRRLSGPRGEIAQGLPSVTETALPAYRSALDRGCDPNTAGVYALLRLIALGKDTNMVHRGGWEKAQQAAEQAAGLLRGGAIPSLEEVAALDRVFIAQNLSPGGCADLLSCTYLLYRWAELRG